MKALSNASAVQAANWVPGLAFCSKSALNAGNDEPDEAFACVARSPGQLLVPRLWQSTRVSDPNVFAGSHFPVRESGRASFANVGQKSMNSQPSGLPWIDLLRLAVERRLLVVVDDELGDGAAACRPGVLEDGGQVRAVGVVPRRDVDLGVLAERIGDDRRQHAALDVVRGHRLPDERRALGVELGEGRARPAREHEHPVRDRDRARDGARHPAPRVADDRVDLVDVDELLGRLDARLRVALAVLGIGQHDLHVRQVELLERLLDVVDPDLRRLVPGLPGDRGVAGEP